MDNYNITPGKAFRFDRDYKSSKNVKILNFKGKTSIKKVLPVLAPELSYSDLDIQEGGQASDTWNSVVRGEYSETERMDKVEHLLKYCKLDTYAMVLILKHLKEIIK